MTRGVTVKVRLLRTVIILALMRKALELYFVKFPFHCFHLAFSNVSARSDESLPTFTYIIVRCFFDTFYVVADSY